MGCGDGEFTALLAQKCKSGHVVGIDAAQDMIASDTFSDSLNLSFKKMDATSLQFNQKSNLVFSNFALHWVKNHQPVLKGICNSLNTHGKRYLRFAGMGTLDAFQRIIDSILISKRWAPYLSTVESGWWFLFETV